MAIILLPEMPDIPDFTFSEPSEEFIERFEVWCRIGITPHHFVIYEPESLKKVDWAKEGF